MDREYSPNPWSCDGDLLDEFACPLDPTQILDRIRATLRGWPGLVTSLLDDEGKHSRLIRTIAGYPEIESSGSSRSGGPTPFDIPLETSSTRSFELTLSLDSFPPVKFSSSLWTEILEFEYEFGGYNPKMKTSERLEVALCLLFLGLGEPVSRKGQRIELSRAAQSLLAEIFSYTNDGLGRWHRVVKRMRNPSVKWTKKESFNTRTVQFMRIKNWMNEIIPGPSRNPGLSQTYLRGGSALISAALGERRQSNRNFSEVLVDGGGRIVTKSQDPRFPHGGFRTEVLDSLYDVKTIFSYEEAIRIESGRNRVNFGQTTIPEFSLIEAITPLVEEHSNLNADPKLVNRWGRFDDEIKWEVVVVQDLEDPENIEDLLENLNNRSNVTWRGFTILDDDCPDHLKAEFRGNGIIHNIEKRRPRIVPPWDLECPRCNAHLKIGTNERKEILDGSGGFCRGHWLLHEIGHKQRTRDSALRQPSKDKENIDFPPKQREVLSVARIDGNSIGWILNPKRFEGSEMDFSDGIRRRSMRFNAHWWRSLAFALQRINQDDPDRVSCWVSAGDDIIIAEYGEVGSDINSEGVKGTISAFVESLNEGINRELSKNPEGPLASISAGISHRKEGGISGMVSKTEDLEAEVKYRWKKTVSEAESTREMISPEKLEQGSIEVNRMILDLENGELGFTRNHMRKIAEKHHLSTEKKDELAKLQEICLRSEVVQQLDSLKILIPGKSGSKDVVREAFDVRLEDDFDPEKESYSLAISDVDSESN